MTTLALSILEQVPVFRDATAAAAAQQAVELAVRAEELGYRRFWVAEHHDDPSRGCASPEVLSAFIAPRTRHIRVGAGCVLMPLTSPRRVFEQWSLLASVAPGRVDLGLGRGAGTPTRDGHQARDPFPEQLSQLMNLLSPPGTRPESLARDRPQPWLMGSGECGALTAARFGLPFAFAQFAHHRPRPDITALYAREFRASQLCAEPLLTVAVRISCAETADAARRQALAIWLPVLSRRNGAGAVWRHATYPSADDIGSYRVSDQESEAMRANPYLTVTGTPEDVVNEVLALATTYGTREVALTTTCPDYTERAETFELVTRHMERRQDQAPTRKDNTATTHAPLFPSQR